MSSRLRKFRKKRGYTIDRLAERIGTDRTTVIRTENRDIFTPRLREICHVLGIRPAQLLEARDYPPDLWKLMEAYERVPETSRARILRMMLAFLEDEEDASVS